MVQSGFGFIGFRIQRSAQVSSWTSTVPMVSILLLNVSGLKSSFESVWLVRNSSIVYPISLLREVLRSSTPNISV